MERVVDRLSEAIGKAPPPLPFPLGEKVEAGRAAG